MSEPSYQRIRLTSMELRAVFEAVRSDMSVDDTLVSVNLLGAVTAGRHRRTIAAAHKIATELSLAWKDDLSQGDLEGIAERVGYGVTPGRVMEVYREYKAWRTKLDDPRHIQQVHRILSALRFRGVELARAGEVVPPGGLSEAVEAVEIGSFRLTEGLSHQEVEELLASAAEHVLADGELSSHFACYLESWHEAFDLSKTLYETISSRWRSLLSGLHAWHLGNDAELNLHIATLRQADLMKRGETLLPYSTTASSGTTNVACGASGAIAFVDGPSQAERASQVVEEHKALAEQIAASLDFESLRAVMSKMNLERDNCQKRLAWLNLRGRLPGSCSLCR